jgi:G3E family GTPase
MRVKLLFGFLGSGKTALARRLIGERGRDLRTAVIVNEFGDVGIDGEILRGNDVDVAELNSGCLYCTLKGSLQLAIEELRARRTGWNA